MSLESSPAVFTNIVNSTVLHADMLTAHPVQ